MAQEVILAQQNITDFYLSPAYGFCVDKEPSIFLSPLEVGETYNVVWSGESYTVEAFAANVSGFGDLVAIGDGSILEYPESDAPFIIAWSEGAALFLAFDYPDNPAEFRHIGIYREVAEEPEAEVGTSIVLKDRNGNDVTYEGIETVTFDTPVENETATFTLGVEQKGLEVALNLKDGDQPVKADTGHLLKKLTIKKPESLKPENIRFGENVGGVDGAFKGFFDVSDENLKFFSCRIDEENKMIFLTSIFYDVLLETTGSYDVNVPDKIAGYDVIIICQ